MSNNMSLLITLLQDLYLNASQLEMQRDGLQRR